MTYHSYYGIINTIMARKIVTNLRIDENDWLQVKTVAAELGMSVNEYINYLLQNIVPKAQFGYPKKSKIRKRKSIYDLLPVLLQGKHKKEGFELSEDDKIIYGV
ncbi:MAG: hypothetical protein US99_C0037G0003 [Candidatus Daviesbacteria bacterium GW2011_GWF2_38_6]|uniref:Uncharacterized protein n=1 Tax=Candidatus Daviesbacteria bacterium GW2011_GWF2_38_6 TaxID=1618432 RepID=A0A0G0KDF8_9BACT|nr:MAG: hypothetical protein US99_C0037G0003 [Candidatus Daviesbacteria bacterium GW2011_GWF2_38_6]